MRAVALDVHRDFCEVAIFAEGRLRSAGRIKTRPDELELSAQSLDARDWVALEVTGNAWAIAGILEPHVARVIVVSPSDTGIRQARAKTYRLDARALAKLLWAGELDGVWTPDERVRVMRRRLARRAQLVRARSRVKNEIHAVLMRCLKDRPPGRRTCSASMAGAGWPNSSWRSASARPSTPACARSTSSTRRSPQVDQLIAADALSWPEVKRLMTVPGVNVTVAATFMAAVGDIRRFGDRRKRPPTSALTREFVSPAPQPPITGTSPSRAPTAPGTRSLRRAGRPSATPGPIAAFYARVKAKRGYSIAIVASARKLACVFWCRLGSGG